MNLNFYVEYFPQNVLYICRIIILYSKIICTESYYKFLYTFQHYYRFGIIVQLYEDESNYR